MHYSRSELDQQRVPVYLNKLQCVTSALNCKTKIDGLSTSWIVIPYNILILFLPRSNVFKELFIRHYKHLFNSLECSSEYKFCCSEAPPKIRLYSYKNKIRINKPKTSNGSYYGHEFTALILKVKIITLYQNLDNLLHDRILNITS